MSKLFKILLLSFTLIFAFLVIADNYVCEDFSPKKVADTCCLQSCPAHHLAPVPELQIVPAIEQAPQLFAASVPLDYSFLLIQSIFRPPQV